VNATEFSYLLNKPNAVQDKHTESLEQIVQEFPYFQSARALYLKGLYNQSSFKYNQQLKNNKMDNKKQSQQVDLSQETDSLISPSRQYRKLRIDIINEFSELRDQNTLAQEDLMKQEQNA